MTHRAELRAFVTALLRGDGCTADTDDVMQELWLRCSEVDVTAIRDPRAYLYRMGQNLVLDRFRRSIRGRNYDAHWGYVHNRTQASDEQATVERALLARERLVAIDCALQSVGERAAWIFRRYRIDGIHQHQITDDLGVSLSTVEKDLRRAYQAVAAINGAVDED